MPEVSKVTKFSDINEQSIPHGWLIDWISKYEGSLEQKTFDPEEDDLSKFYKEFSKEDRLIIS